MNATEITIFRQKLSDDAENKTARQTFHEHFEWLESYWDERYKSNKIQRFCNEFHNFFWNNEELKETVRQFSLLNPVGRSTLNFDPAPNVEQATYFLKYKCYLTKVEFLEIEEETLKANKWKSNGFHALLIILEQVRNNLFHGKKMEINEPHYSRNKILVGLAAKATTLILDNLDTAENA